MSSSGFSENSSIADGDSLLVFSKDRVPWVLPWRYGVAPDVQLFNEAFPDLEEIQLELLSNNNSAIKDLTRKEGFYSTSKSGDGCETLLKDLRQAVLLNGVKVSSVFNDEEVFVEDEMINLLKQHGFKSSHAEAILQHYSTKTIDFLKQPVAQCFSSKHDSPWSLGMTDIVVNIFPWEGEAYISVCSKNTEIRDTSTKEVVAVIDASVSAVSKLNLEKGFCFLGLFTNSAFLKLIYASDEISGELVAECIDSYKQSGDMQKEIDEQIQNLQKNRSSDEATQRCFLLNLLKVVLSRESGSCDERTLQRWHEVCEQHNIFYPLLLLASPACSPNSSENQLFSHQNKMPSFDVLKSIFGVEIIQKHLKKESTQLSKSNDKQLRESSGKG